MTATTPPSPALVRPFTVSIPDSEIDDVKQRLARTRWPDPETVGDWSQGVRVENARSLVDYWERGYDWRRFESELNRFPQFLTEIDGLDIHFIHVRSRNPNAMPLILTHGWPGSIVEFLKLIGPLTDPVSFGGDEAGDCRIRPGGLSRWSGSLDLRQVPVQDRQPRARRGRPQHRRHARCDIPVLVHQQRSVVRPHLLGEQIGHFRRPEADASGRGDRLPEGHPTPATKLDRRHLQQSDPLRRGRQGRAL